ncbi:sensor histidine kinase [Georgenia ruanii]|uniref:Signal transduction histidine-protein kinase/phosphatase MprB n=1 Tax=Georgenia ruanii TaxID=348442 RepID=A0A7J9UZB3_9MICO|nr:HAMP domain-containing sensor histidine kinase [Georgenia ruanii]MPV89772.1 HAMP domain-containing protein [Georgenia ruanii]
MRSLLVRYGLAMTSVVLVAFLVPLGLLARSLAEERGLDGGRQDAQSVAVFAAGSQDATQLEAAVLAVNDGARRTTVFLPDGRVVGEPAAPSSAVELAGRGRALTARTNGGVEVLLPVGGPTGVAVVRTFVPDAALTQGVQRSWLLLAGVGVVLLGATALAGGLIARRLSRSVLELSEVADRLGNGDLSARVEPSGPPEVASVGRVLNGLGARVAGLLAAEREVVADVSHRLRTPITALRLDVDLLADRNDRERLAGHVDHLVSAVDEVIRTARQGVQDAPAARCDAVAVARERARFWRLLATDQGRELRVDAPGEALMVGLSAADLGAGLDALVDNVFTHTQDGTAFALVVTAARDLVRVAVEDRGAGFPIGDLAARGRSGTGSTGLGLDVARTTAERAGGRLLLEHPATGARVVLELPRLA